MTKEEAIEILNKYAPSTNSFYMCTSMDVLMAISTAISTLKQQKTGRWKHGKCSECGGYAPNYPSYIESKFCPNCGAKMGEEGE